jgi:hypothetical protein
MLRRFWKWVWRNWVNFVVVCIGIFTIVVIYNFFVEWHGKNPPTEKLLGTPSYIWFGFSTVGSLVVSLLVLAAVKKKTFSDSAELLKRFITIFDEAKHCKGQTKISLLHFVPCPGLFDEMFKKPRIFPRRMNFSKLERLVSDVIKKPNVTTRVAMLDNLTSQRFLKAFFKHEKQEVSAKALGANPFDKYYQMASLFVVSNFGPKCVAHINKTWLDKSMKGDEFIILGAAEKNGFIGSISFEGGDFQFRAADYVGDTTVIHELFDRLVTIYRQ